MAYINVSDGTSGQIFSFDTTNVNKVTLDTSNAALTTTVQGLQAALASAQRLATAFGVDTSGSSTSGTTTSGSTTSSGTSGGTAS